MESSVIGFMKYKKEHVSNRMAAHKQKIDHHEWRDESKSDNNKCLLHLLCFQEKCDVYTELMTHGTNSDTLLRPFAWGHLVIRHLIAFIRIPVYIYITNNDKIRFILRYQQKQRLKIINQSKHIYHESIWMNYSD